MGVAQGGKSATGIMAQQGATRWLVGGLTSDDERACRVHMESIHHRSHTPAGRVLFVACVGCYLRL